MHTTITHMITVLETVLSCAKHHQISHVTPPFQCCHHVSDSNVQSAIGTRYHESTVAAEMCLNVITHCLLKGHVEPQQPSLVAAVRSCLDHIQSVLVMSVLQCIASVVNVYCIYVRSIRETHCYACAECHWVHVRVICLKVYLDASASKAFVCGVTDLRIKN